MNLGNDEILECYIGSDAITEAYLGEDLVFSSGPFQGLKISPRSISFNSESLTANLKIKSSESWAMTLPDWVGASSTTGDSGETIITLTATAQTANTQGTIVVDSANYSASVNVNFYVVQFINYIHSQTMNNNRDEYLVTSIYPTLSTKGEILLQHKGYITGNALVGMYGNGGSWDNKDWRLFTYQTKWNMDVGGPRVANNLGGISNGQDYDISFGNHYIINNGNGQSVTGATQSLTLDNLPIKICLGVVWVKEVKLWEGETLVFDGKAAKKGDQYGLFDLVSGTLLTTNDFTIVGEE